MLNQQSSEVCPQLLLKAVKFLRLTALQNGSLCCRESGTHGRKLSVQATAVLIWIKWNTATFVMESASPEVRGVIGDVVPQKAFAFENMGFDPYTDVTSVGWVGPGCGWKAAMAEIASTCLELPACWLMVFPGRKNSLVRFGPCYPDSFNTEAPKSSLQAAAWSMWAAAWFGGGELAWLLYSGCFDVS